MVGVPADSWSPQGRLLRRPTSHLDKPELPTCPMQRHTFAGILEKASEAEETTFWSA
jgi:hypothetical protein